MRRVASTVLLLGVVLLLGATATVYAVSRTVTGGGPRQTAQLAALGVNQDVTGPLAPGAPAQLLHGTFTNPTQGTIHVRSLTAHLSAVHTAPNGPAGPCDLSDYTLTDPTTRTDQDVPVGRDVGAWSGPHLGFNDKPDSNQDGCIGAQVLITYTLS